MSVLLSNWYRALGESLAPPLDGANWQGPGLQKWQFHRMLAGSASISMFRATKTTAAPHSVQWKVSPAWMSSSVSSTWANLAPQLGQGKYRVCFSAIVLPPVVVVSIQVRQAHDLALGESSLEAEHLAGLLVLGAGGAEGGEQFGAGWRR